MIGFLFPTYKEPSEAIDPRMRSFHNPSPCFEAPIGFPLRFFLSPRFDVGSIVPATKKRANVLGVVTFVKADVLVSVAGWLWAFNWNAVEGRLKKFHVVRVSAADLDTQRYSATISKHRAFGSKLAAIGWVFAGFFPRPAVTWSSLRQRFANSTGCLLVRRSPTARPSTTCERRLLPAILESNDASCYRNRTLGALLSIGNRCARRKRCHPQFFSTQYVVDHPWGSSCNAVAAVPTGARVHPGDAKRIASVLLPLETPPCWHKMSDKSLSVRR